MSDYPVRRLAWPSVIACVSVLGTNPAVAQQAAAPSGVEAAAPASPESGGLEEITVTSRKRPETLIQTPVAITAISAAEIESAGMKDLVDLSNFTPGFEFEDQTINRNDRGYAEYSMRGMFPNSAFSGRANVQVLIDGSSVLGGHVPGLEDVGSVEVVKGPQSAYFGRSSFGGAVSFATKNPYFEFGGDINADIYNYGGRDISASVNVPIVEDKLAIRVSARDYHTDGQYGNALDPGTKLGEQNTQSGALTALFTPTDNLRIKLYVTGWKDDDGQGATAIYATGQNCDTNHGGFNNYFCGTISEPNFTYGANPFPPAAAADMFQNAANLRTLYGESKLDHPGLDRIAYEAHANVEYTFESGYTLSLIAAYDRDDFEVSDDLILTTLPPGAGLYFRADESDRDGNVEIHLASPSSDAIKWLIGADYYRIRTSNTTIGYLPFLGALQFNDVNLDNSDTYSIFGSASYEIIDGLTLSVEGRAQWDDIYAAEAGGTANAAEFRSFTPRIILSYQFDPKTNVYFSYARGNRPGEFNSTITGLDPRSLAEFEALTGAKIGVPEETLDMYELGAKGLFFDNTLRVLAALYYGEWDNQHVQVNQNIIDYGEHGAIVGELADVAVGETLLSGIELEADYHPINELTIRGTYDIANTNIRKYDCINCITLTGFNDAIGNRLEDTPKYTATVSATYEAPVYEDIKGFVRGDMIWRGTSYESESNLAQTGESTIFNLQAGIETDQYKITLYGKNITNDKHLLQLQYTTSSLTGANALSASLPVKPIFGIRGSYKF
jgi:iron complex outermembrane receptor protein